jgi:pimeloyl-ACP methyl ester carboxylesterase
MLYHKVFSHESSSEWVVFVHGAGGSSNLFFKQIKAFNEQYNVLLLDLRGHGKSNGETLADYFKRPYTFESVSTDILEVLDHQKIEKAHFVGISLGTIIIRTIGELAPERVHSLIMGGAIARLNFRSKILVSFGNLIKRVVPYMWLYRFVAWIIMPKKRHSVARALFIREAGKLCQREFLRWFKLTNELNPLLKYFGERDLKLPALYIMGSEDYMFLPQIKELIKTQTQAILKVVDSGHVCNIEAPEAFNRLSLQFLTEQVNKPPVY